MIALVSLLFIAMIPLIVKLQNFPFKFFLGDKNISELINTGSNKKWPQILFLRVLQSLINENSCAS